MNGERHPGDVYKDFRSAVIRILGMQDNPPIFSNGKAASVPNDVTVELPTMVIIYCLFLFKLPIFCERFDRRKKV